MSARPQHNRRSVATAVSDISDTAGPTELRVLEIPTTADDVAAAWLVGYDANTRQAYARDLRRWGAWLTSTGTADPFAARRAHVDAWVQSMKEEGAADSTIRRRLASVSGFYGYAVGEGLIDRSPVVNVRRPRGSDESPQLGLSERQMIDFLKAAKPKPRDYALACLLVFNGLRISEALSADVSDLGEERGHRTLTITRKGGKRVKVPLAAPALDALTAYLDGRDSGPLFMTSTGKRLDRVGAWRVVVRLARAAGIDGNVSPHTLRHGFVTAALDAGVDLRDVQDAAGHADPRTTRRYDRRRHVFTRHPTYRLAAVLSEDDDQRDAGEGEN